jgi:hypothetical protein
MGMGTLAYRRAMKSARCQSKIFDNLQRFHPLQFLDESEKFKVTELGKLLGDHKYQLRLGLFFEGAFVGWAIGDQETSETFYMRNSAIRNEERRTGDKVSAFEKKNIMTKFRR